MALAARIVRAIAALERVPEVDVIVIARGGGSAEDLSAYNEEILVRKVADCSVPIVSAVGHEVDTTLVDLAADARASTPSQAAEMLVPDATARRAELDHWQGRLRRAIGHELRGARHGLERLRTGLASSEFIEERQQTIDEARMRLKDQAALLVARRRATLDRSERRLEARHPRAVLAAARASLVPLDVRLGAAMRRLVSARRHVIARSVAGLDALSPLAILARGYAIATDEDGHAIIDSTRVSQGQRIDVRLHRGSLSVDVVAAHGARGEPPRGAT